MAVEGINTTQLGSFNKQYTSSPSSFTLGIEGRTIWEERGLGSLGKVDRWSLGGQTMEKPTRDFSVQLGSWREVGDAIGVQAADDRLEPVEAALLGLSSCVTEAIVLNCARTGVDLKGLEETGTLVGTWRHAEDGGLSRNPVAQGSIDAVGEIDVKVPAFGTAIVTFWIAARALMTA